MNALAAGLAGASARQASAMRPRSVGRVSVMACSCPAWALVTDSGSRATPRPRLTNSAMSVATITRTAPEAKRARLRFLDLAGQFAGWHKHKPAGTAGAGVSTGQRNAEPQSLAGAMHDRRALMATPH